MRIEIKQIEIHFVCETLQRGAWGRQEGGGAENAGAGAKVIHLGHLAHQIIFGAHKRYIFKKIKNQRKKKTHSTQTSVFENHFSSSSPKRKN